MTRRSPAVVIVLLFAFAGMAGCTGSSVEAHRGLRSSSRMDFHLERLPVVARRACVRAQRLTSFRVLCPSVLPRPIGDGPPLTVGVGVRRGRFFSIVFSYGIPGRVPIDGNVPFLHFDVNRQNSVNGGGPPPRRAQPAVVGGLRGLLLAADGQGGWFGNHLRFFWRDSRGRRYVITLHDIGPDTRPLLDELVRGLVPARSLAN